MPQVVHHESMAESLQRMARIAAILTVCVLVMAAVYLATLYLIAAG